MKVCLVIFRVESGQTEILAFEHPSAGKQLVKGSIAAGERPVDAAHRELAEESGLVVQKEFRSLGTTMIGGLPWHFFAARMEGLAARWRHQTVDDFGHVFHFFWHPLDTDLDAEWHAQFHAALHFIRRQMPGGGTV